MAAEGSVPGLLIHAWSRACQAIYASRQVLSDLTLARAGSAQIDRIFAKEVGYRSFVLAYKPQTGYLSQATSALVTGVFL